MKKLIAILLSAVLLVTSMLSVSMFTASAEGEDLADTVVMPTFVDADGNEINVYHTMENIPASVVSSGNKEGVGTVTVEKNTSDLPTDVLFSISPECHDYATRIDFAAVTGGKGAIFYVEAPEIDSYTLQISDSDGGEPNGTTKTTTKHRLAIMMIVKGEDGKDIYTQQYARSRPVYTVAEGQTEWQAQTMGGNGVALDSGFKGYVYIPFSSLDENHAWTGSEEVIGIQFSQLTNAVSYDETSKKYVSDWTQVSGRPNPWYGWIPEGKRLLVSAPAIVTGSIDTDTDASNSVLDAEIDRPSAESVVYKGTEYEFFATVKGIEQSSGIAATVTSDANFSNYSDDKSITHTRTETSSVTPLTQNKSNVISGYTNTWATGNQYYTKALVWQNFTEGALYKDADANVVNTGFMFYTELAAQTDPHYLYFELQGKNSSGGAVTAPYFHMATSSAGHFYYLPIGGTSWVKSTDKSSNNYGISLNDAGKAFKGWVYIPFAYFTSRTFVSIDNINIHTNNSSGDITVSSIVLVNSLDISNTYAYGSNGLVNLSKNVLCTEADYDASDVFYGNSELPNYGNSNVLEFETPNDSLLMSTNIAMDTNKVYSTGTPANFNYKVVNSVNPMLKMPMYEAVCHTAGTLSNDRVAYIDTDTYYTKGYDGFMVYVKNDSPTAKKFQLATYAYWAATYTDPDERVEYDDGTGTRTALTSSAKAYCTAKAYMLSDATGTWTTSATTNNEIPANSGAYLYVPMTEINRIGSSGFYENDDTYIFDVSVITAATEYAVNDKLTISFPMMVTKWSNENAGVAFVNGAAVSQNIWTGDFATPYDYNGTLTTDLVDLVQAKEEANSTDFDAFRKAYLKDYFNDAEYSVLSAAFSVAPLTYSEEDASTILSENPDRGYRTEMVLYLKEGTPDPLYKTVYYVGDQTDEQERVSGLEFETREAAQAYIDARVAEESAFKLTYYQNKEQQVATGTIEPQYTYAIDKEVYKTKTSYYVYRAFESYEVARAFMYEQKLLRGDSGYEIYTIYADTDEVDENGNTIHNTYYRIGYDKRCVFTGDSEEEQTKAIDREIRAYFKIILNDNYEEVMQEGIDPSKLTLTYLYLTDWNGASASDLTAVEELPDSALNTVELYFERMKTRGLKTEARFSYNVNVSRTWRYSDANVTFDNGNIVETPNGSQPYNDDWLAENCANEGTILRHIEQLAPIVAEYAECFHNISNGFIGYVGEMVYGYQYPVVNYVTVQKAIVEKLCAPNDLFFSTRSPSYKQAIANADADWEYMDYICINNDAIYGEQTNSGWNSGGYQIGNPDDLDTDWWAWMTANAYKTPQGGETFTQKALLDVDDNDVADYSKMLNGHEVLLELVHHRHTSFSYWHGYLEGTAKEYNIMKNWMNPESEYYSPVTPAILKGMGIAYDPAWFNGTEERNVYEFIRDHLGYRIAAQDVSVDYDSKVSDKLRVSVDLKNYGFAAAFNMSSTLAILDANGNVVQQLKVGDPSKWYSLAPDYYTVERTSSAQGDVLTHNLSAEFDALTKSGTYYVAVKLENTAGTTARFANDVEVNEQGYNILGSFVATVIAQ